MAPTMSFLPGLMMMLSIGGGGVDLMDFLATDDYWRAKSVEVTAEMLIANVTTPTAKTPDVSGLIKQLGDDSFKVREAAEAQLAAMGPAIASQVRKAVDSTDAEVAVRAARILQQLIGGTMGPRIRRLMAIRTLGERKVKTAAGVLRTLTESKDFFVADYARQAVAAIEGKPYQRKGATAKQMETDLWSMPPDCLLVKQNHLVRGRPKPLASQLAAMENMPGVPDAAMMKRQVTKVLIDTLEMVGNIRLNGDTTALAGEAGQASPNVCAVIRGRYDVDAVRGVLKRFVGKPRMIDGVEVYGVGGTVFLPLSAERFALVLGAGEEGFLNLVLAALKDPAKGIKSNAAMVKLIRAAETDAPLWGVARVAGLLAKAELLAAFQTLKLVGKRNEGKVNLRLTAVGEDELKVAAAVEQFTKHLAKARKDIAREVTRQSYLKPIQQFLATVKIEQIGATAVATASMADDWSMIAPQVLPMIYMMSSFGPLGDVEPDVELPPIQGDRN